MFEGFKDFWRRQSRNFKVIMVRDVLNHLFASGSMGGGGGGGGGGGAGGGEGEVVGGGQYWTLFLRRLGADSTQIGLIRSVNSAVNMLLATPLGWLIDRTPKKKRAYVFGKVLALPATLMRYIATTWPFGMLTGIWDAISGRLMAPPSQIILIDSLSDKDRLKGLTINRTVMSIAGLIGPILCALVINYFGGLESADSIRPIFLIQFAVGFATLILVVVKMQEVNFPVVGRNNSIVDHLTGIFKEIPILKLLVLRQTLRTFFDNFGNPFLTIYLVDVKGANEFTLAARSTAITAYTVLSTIPIGMLADRFGRFKVAYLGRFIGAAGVLLMIFTPSTHPEILIMAGVLESTLILMFIGFTAFEQELVPLEARGRYMGTTMTLNGLANVVAPILGGIVWNLNPDYLWWIRILGDLLIVLPLIMVIERRSKKEHAGRWR